MAKRRSTPILTFPHHGGREKRGSFGRLRMSGRGEMGSRRFANRPYGWTCCWGRMRQGWFQVEGMSGVVREWAPAFAGVGEKGAGVGRREVGVFIFP